MFTVKHIVDGTETLFQTETCRYSPADDKSPTTATPVTLWVDHGPLTGGRCFIMNENGKTVGHYQLDVGGSQ